MIVKTPTIFVSYAWEDDVNVWVRDFATRLRRQGGVDVKIDQWEVAPGDPLPVFMEKSIRTSDFILIVCTPKYKSKSDARQGGVGYEGHIITGELVTNANHCKFIPVLRKGEWPTAAPSFLQGNAYLDLRGDPYNEATYGQLLKVFHRQLTMPPTIALRPAFGGGIAVAGGVSPAETTGRGSAQQVGSEKLSRVSLMGIRAFALLGGSVVLIAVLVAVSMLLMSSPSTQAETPPSTRAEIPPSARSVPSITRAEIPASTRAETLGRPERGWIEAYGAAIDSGNVDRILALHVIPTRRFFEASNQDAAQLRTRYQGWFDKGGRTRRTGFDRCSLANVANDGSRSLRCDTYVDPPFSTNTPSRVATCLVFTKDGKLLSRTEVSRIPDCPPR